MRRDGALETLRERYAAARRAGERTPWRAARYCAVDLELTGLDDRRHEIVSFGAVPIEEGRIRLGDAIGGAVRPEGPIEQEAIRVHGLRVEDLLAAPREATALRPLVDALAGVVMVAHFAEIERRFLQRAFRRMGVRMPGAVLDTSVLGALWLSERDGVAPRRLPLPELAAALGLPSHRPHEALGDALTTAQVFLALASHLDAMRPETVRSLATAGRRLRAASLYPPDG